MKLTHISDKELLKDIKKLAKEERDCTLRLLYHLKEIERRRLFADAGYSSLFDYVVRELGYSEPAAGRRINSARLLSEFPMIAPKLSNGDLSLSNVSKVANLFKHENFEQDIKRSILAQVENKSARECDKVLALFSQNPVLPSGPQIKTITPELSSFRVIIGDKTLKSFEKLQSHLAHKRFTEDELLNFIFNLALEKLLIDKYHLLTKGRTTISRSRTIPTEVRRRVFLRDKGRCRNCKGVYKLEFDHITPFSQGGSTSEENLRLLCFSCNQRARIRNGNSGPGSNVDLKQF